MVSCGTQMPAGRPPTYCSEIVEKAADYLVNYSSLGHMIPSAAGLSLHLGVARSTVYEWADDPDKYEFSDIFHKIQATQEQLLVSNGLSGEFNAQITKLVLGKHGYQEQTKTEHAGEVSLNAMSDEALNARISALLGAHGR